MRPPALQLRDFAWLRSSRPRRTAAQLRYMTPASTVAAIRLA